MPVSAVPTSPDSEHATDARPRRSRLRRVVFGVLVAVALLALFEVGLRVVGFSHTPGYRPGAEVPDSARLHELDDERMYERDEELFWRLRPNATIDINDPAYPRFRTNAFGLRGDPVPTAKPDGELRVLCLGDSITFGLGLAQGQTMPERLAVALSEHLPQGFASARVLNAGVSGYSSVQGERLYARLAELDPDVIVFWFGMNDAKLNLGLTDSQMTLPDPPSRVLESLQSLRLVQLAQTQSESGNHDRWLSRVGPDEFQDIAERFRALERTPDGPRVIFVRSPERMQTTLDQLAHMAEVTRGAGATGVRAHSILLTPYAPGPDAAVRHMKVRDDTQGKVAEFGDGGAPTQQVRVEVIEERVEELTLWLEALERLREALPKERAVGFAELFGSLPPDVVFSDNCHLTPTGADAAARALAAEIRRALR